MRLDRITPERLDADQRALYDAIAGGPRANGPFRLTDDDGGLEGPFNAMLLAPRLGSALQALGSAIRYEGALADRHREIAILVVAAHGDSAFERHAHEAVGRRVGLTEPELTSLRALAVDDLPDPGDRLIATTTLALARRGDLDDGEYAAAVPLGLPVLFELLTLVGYYATLALQLRVFRVPAPGA